MRCNMQLIILRLGFVVLCAALGIVAWWLNGFVFERFEVVEGVNLTGPTDCVSYSRFYLSATQRLA